MKRAKIDCCLMPKKTKRSEAQIYLGMRDTIIRAHCAAERGHKCCGAITIDREHMTLNCKLCGDVRTIL